MFHVVAERLRIREGSGEGPRGRCLQQGEGRSRVGRTWWGLRPCLLKTTDSLELDLTRQILKLAGRPRTPTCSEPGDWYWNLFINELPGFQKHLWWPHPPFDRGAPPGGAGPPVLEAIGQGPALPLPPSPQLTRALCPHRRGPHNKHTGPRPGRSISATPVTARSGRRGQPNAVLIILASSRVSGGPSHGKS